MLSNLVNSGIYSIFVLIQFRSQSLLQHLSDGWQFGSMLKSEFIVPVPVQMRTPGKQWYRGTADAIHQNPNAPTMPDDPNRVYASMGNFVFSKDMLLRKIEEDQQNTHSSHDFGKDILPKAVDPAEMFAYNFNTNQIPGKETGEPPYWRDVGSLDAFCEANMDIHAITPQLNLFNQEWPLRTISYSDPPAKFAFDEEDRRGQAIDSVLSGGCLLSGGQVRNSVLGRHVYVHAGAEIDECVIFDNCDIGVFACYLRPARPPARRTDLPCLR